MQTLSQNTSCYELISIFVLINSIFLLRTNAMSCAYVVYENKFVRQTNLTSLFSSRVYFHLTLVETTQSAIKNFVGNSVFMVTVWSNICTVINTIAHNIYESLYGLKEREIQRENYQSRLRSLFFIPTSITI